MNGKTWARSKKTSVLKNYQSDLVNANFANEWKNLGEEQKKQVFGKLPKRFGKRRFGE